VPLVKKETPKPSAEVKKKPSPRPKSTKKVNPKEEAQKELPTDFKSHSCLFSAGQLDRLRSFVYLKKGHC
jgi:hypothetical protein